MEKFYKISIFAMALLFGVLFLPSSAEAAFDWAQTNTTGFIAGEDNNFVNNFAAYNNKLYATTFNEPDECSGGVVDDGNQIWRSSDGASWSRITDTDLRCLTDNSLIIEFDGNVYLGTQFLANLDIEKVRIFCSATGNSDTWTQVGADNFGHVTSGEVRDMIVFGGELYAILNFPDEVPELWKSADGSTWTEVDTSEVADFKGTTFKIYDSKLFLAGLKVFSSVDGSTWIENEDFADLLGSDFSEVTVLESFGSNLYAYLSMFESGVRVYRSATGANGTWTQVNTDGFGDTGNGWLTPFAYKRMKVIGNVLYVGTNNLDGAEMWRTTNGTTWELEFDNGLGTVANSDMTALIEFNDRIYIGLGPGDPDVGAGAEVWRTRPPNEWEAVVDDGNGNASPNYSPNVLEEFEDALYLGEFTGACEGARIFKTINGTSWEEITDADFAADLCEVNDFASLNGFVYFVVTEDDAPSPQISKIFRSDTGDDNSWTLAHSVVGKTGWALTSFNSKLYVAYEDDIYESSDGTTWTLVETLVGAVVKTFTVHESAIYAAGGELATNRAKIWRSTNGTDWTEVADFGVGSNEIRTATSFSGFIYVMTYPDSDGYGIWRSDTGNSGTWTQVNEDGFGDPNNKWTSAFPLRSALAGDVVLFGLENTVTGGELWGSPNGTTWTQIGEDGFGFVANEGFIALAIFGDRIYLGARNQNGYQIWRSPDLDPLIYLQSDGGVLTTPGEANTNPEGALALPVADTRQLPNATKGQSYSVQLEAHWGDPPYTYTITSGALPPGLTLSASGLISGTPTSNTPYAFTVGVEDSEGDEGSQPFALEVLPATGSSVYKHLFMAALMTAVFKRKMRKRSTAK